MFRGTFIAAHDGSTPGVVAVYDEGLLLSFTTKPRGGLGGHAAGFALANTAKVTVDRLKDRVDAVVVDAGLFEAPLLIGGYTRAVPESTIRQLRLKKGFGWTRHLYVTELDGTTTNLAFFNKKVPVSAVKDLLEPVVGQRLSVEVAK